MVALRSAFSLDYAAFLRDQVWHHIEATTTARQHDPATWSFAGPWEMPSGWHIDFGTDQPTWPVPAVKLFALLDTVEPAGGGTLLLFGSHRLVERLAEANGGPVDPWDHEARPLESDPYLGYVANPVAVKAAYDLWVTQAESDAIARVLDSCAR